MNRGHVPALDFLRGFAALWVALYHFTDSPETRFGYPLPGLLSSIGRHGYLGLYIFFVVSGFVIPLSLDRGGYKWKDAGRFMAKRMLRLSPLYLLTVVGVTIHSWPNVTWSQWWPHVFHLNELMARSWLLPIFWTLAIEMQFYLVIAVIFPLMGRGPVLRQHIVIAMYVLLGLGSLSSAIVFHYGALFGMGIYAFRSVTGRDGWAVTCSAMFFCWMVASHSHTYVHASIGAATIVAIFCLRWQGPLIAFFGAISYPFYLVHSMAGGFVGGLFAQLPRSVWTDSLGVISSLAASVLAAWILHVTVELTCQRWSSQLRYR